MPPQDQDLSGFASAFSAIVSNTEKAVKGKTESIRLAALCLVSGGHLLIEDVPGVGKTTLAKALASSIAGSWRRVQFTPDLLPTDLTGVSILNRTDDSFVFHPGPLFANVVLADEVNRASPKTQSALLEAMEEQQITIDGKTRPLPSPFLVIATQNPIEHDGTYRLPESQLDRFGMRITLGYPNREAELEILDASAKAAAEIKPVMSTADVVHMQEIVKSIQVAESVQHYVLDIADASRQHPLVRLGMSPRASVMLLRAAKAYAAARGRSAVWPDDIKAMAEPVLAHRMVLTTDARLDGYNTNFVVQQLLATVTVPDKTLS